MSRGQSLFNEAAFDRGEALYDGRLLGRPFRAVAKSFQVAVWQDLCGEWWSLGDSDRQALCTLFPLLQNSLFKAECVDFHPKMTH
jgi:hypothetical protein